MPEDTEDILDAAARKPVLVTGATCIDVMISVDRLPVRGGHCRALNQKITLGGCAFNVADVLLHTGTPFKFVIPGRLSRIKDVLNLPSQGTGR